MSKHSLIHLREIFPETTDDFFVPWNGWFHKNNIPEHLTIPPLNVTDEKDHYRISIAVPGLEKSDFDIEVSKNVLTISAASEKKEEEEKKKYRHKEYSYSAFSRSFTLPSDISADSISAQYDKGILSLDLPKNDKGENSHEKKIEVK